MEVTSNYGWEDAEQPESSNYINPYVLRKLDKCPATVLDAGCGNGALSGFLAENGFNVWGVDSDKGGVEIARFRYPNVSYSVGYFGEDPRSLQGSPAEGFDFVVSTEVIEHLYSPQELVKYAFEALKPGGRLIISTPYHGYLKNLALSLLNKWDDHHTALWHGGHIKFWSFETLGALLEENGFVVKERWGVGRVPYLWKSLVLIAERPREELE